MARTIQRTRTTFALLTLLILFFSIAAFGQSVAGSIVGTVSDASGAVIPNATVTLRQPQTSVTRDVKTNDSGNYVFSFVAPGEYVVSASASGFAKLQQPVHLETLATVRADLQLRPGTLGTTVEVIAEAAPPVRTDTAEMSDVVENRRIEQMPLNGRHFADLVLLTPGTSVSATGTSDTPLLQTGPNLNINGSRPTHISYTIDGVSATDLYFSNLSLSMSVDAINEFKVLAGNYNSSLGGKGGGHVTVLSKSGTNRFHGTVFEFLRNDALDARNYFASKTAPKPPYKQNQYGGSVGGPVVKGKVFFFAAYEGSRIRQTISKRATVPTDAMRVGNFAGLPTIYDPNTTAANGARTAFLNNQIPGNRIDNAAKLMIALLPHANLPGFANNYAAAGGRARDDDQGNVRFDYTINPTNSVFARVTKANISSLEPFGARGNNSVPGFASNVTTNSLNAALNYTRAFSSARVMNVLLGFNRVQGGVATTNQKNDIGGQANIAVVNQIDLSLRGVPSVSTNFISSFGDDTSTLLRADNTYQLSAQFSQLVGHHSLTYGGEIQKIQFNPLAAIFARGSYSFSPRYTSSTQTGTNGNGFADFLLGLPFSGSALAGNAYESARGTWYGMYLQDDWRVRDNLTVNLGLRYDLTLPLYDTQNRLAAIDLANKRVVVSSSGDKLPPAADVTRFGVGVPIPFVTSSAAGWPRSLVDVDATNIAPRIGVAFTPFSNFVLRGGYSIVYSVSPLNLQARTDRNPPFSGLIQGSNPTKPAFTTETIFASSVSSPSFGFLARDFKNTRVQEWNFAVEKAVGALTSSVSYVGNHSGRLDWFGSGNPAAPCATNCPALESRRIYPGLGNFTMSRSDAFGNYDALQIRVTQRKWRGLSLGSSFTWSKSLDNVSSSSGDDNSAGNDPFNIRADYGPSSFDRRVTWVLSYEYDVPAGHQHNVFNHGVAAAVLGDWTMGGIVNASAGNHFSVGISSCPANNGGGCRADVLRKPNISGGTPGRWFDTTAFAVPALGNYGNQGRNILVGPGYTDWDFSLHKKFEFTESQHLEFRMEAFNVLNHTNFANPASAFGSITFGTISSAQAARQVQFGLKYVF